MIKKILENYKEVRKLNINIVKEKCTGCGACKYVCPKKCIKMEISDTGFKYPSVNESECINCGICLKKCHLTDDGTKHDTLRVYAAYSIDEIVYKNSASGGIATAISKKFIENGGIVYGCTLNEFFNTEHIRVDNVEDLCLIQDSKYTQSNIDNIFRLLKEDLENHKSVLFISTPCQVGAIMLNFSKYKDQIYVIDLICHGVTNDSIFKSYISYFEKKERIKIIKYKYRSKKSSEYERTETIEYIKKGKINTKSRKLVDSIFYYSYLEGTLSRISCLDCKYKSSNRLGDITLGDYWGYEREFGSNENKMFSKVIINTNKGKNLFLLINDSIKLLESNDILHFNIENKKMNKKLNQEIQRLAINGRWEKINELNHNKEFYIKKIYKFFPIKIKRILNKIIKK